MPDHPELSQPCLDFITLPTWVLGDDDIERLIKNAEQTLDETKSYNTARETKEICEVIKVLRDLLAYRNYSSKHR
jgi:hypothetical protein